jgi:hypothetical protein
MSAGADRIAAERRRQIADEGYYAQHDDEHGRDELTRAAVCYALPAHMRPIRVPGQPPSHYWPWALEDWKPTPDDRVRELVKAGALIAAEIDRLLRQGGDPE